MQSRCKARSFISEHSNWEGLSQPSRPSAYVNPCLSNITIMHSNTLYDKQCNKTSKFSRTGLNKSYHRSKRQVILERHATQLTHAQIFQTEQQGGYCKSWGVLSRGTDGHASKLRQWTYFSSWPWM